MTRVFVSYRHKLLVTHGGVAQIWDLTVTPAAPVVELFASAP